MAFVSEGHVPPRATRREDAGGEVREGVRVRRAVVGEREHRVAASRRDESRGGDVGARLPGPVRGGREGDEKRGRGGGDGEVEDGDVRGDDDGEDRRAVRDPENVPNRALDPVEGPLLGADAEAIRHLPVGAERQHREFGEPGDGEGRLVGGVERDARHLERRGDARERANPRLLGNRGRKNGRRTRPGGGGSRPGGRRRARRSPRRARTRTPPGAQGDGARTAQAGQGAGVEDAHLIPLRDGEHPAAARHAQRASPQRAAEHRGAELLRLGELGPGLRLERPGLERPAEVHQVVARRRLHGASGRKHEPRRRRWRRERERRRERQERDRAVRVRPRTQAPVAGEPIAFAQAPLQPLARRRQGRREAGRARERRAELFERLRRDRVEESRNGDAVRRVAVARRRRLVVGFDVGPFAVALLRRLRERSSPPESRRRRPPTPDPRPPARRGGAFREGRRFGFLRERFRGGVRGGGGARGQAPAPRADDGSRAAVAEEARLARIHDEVPGVTRPRARRAAPARVRQVARVAEVPVLLHERAPARHERAHVEVAARLRRPAAGRRRPEPQALGDGPAGTPRPPAPPLARAQHGAPRRRERRVLLVQVGLVLVVEPEPERGRRRAGAPRTRRVRARRRRPNRRLHLGVPARRGPVVETQLEREVQVQVSRGRDAVPEDPDARARRRVRRESRDTAVVVVVAAAAAAGIIRRSAARPAAARRDARLSLGGGSANRLQSALGGRRSPDAIRIRLAAARMRIVGRRPGARLGRARRRTRRGPSERARRDGEGHGEPRHVEGLLVGVLQFFRTRTRAAFLFPGSLREERRQRSELRVGGLERVRVRDGRRERFGEDVDDVGERLGG